MSERNVTMEWVIGNAYQVLGVRRTLEEAQQFARFARGFADNVTIEARKVNR